MNLLVYNNSWKKNLISIYDKSETATISDKEIVILIENKEYP